MLSSSCNCSYFSSSHSRFSSSFALLALKSLLLRHTHPNHHLAIFYRRFPVPLHLPCGRCHHAAVAEVHLSAMLSSKNPAFHLCLLCSAVSRLFLLRRRPDAACHPLFIIKRAVHKCVTLSASHLLSHHSASVSEALSAPHILTCSLCSMQSCTSCGCHSAGDASPQLENTHMATTLCVQSCMQMETGTKIFSKLHNKTAQGEWQSDFV